MIVGTIHSWGKNYYHFNSTLFTKFLQLFTEFECRYDGNILDEFILPTEDECKSECLIVPNCAYYVYDNANGGCECRDSKATQECDLIRGPQKPSLSADCQ